MLPADEIETYRAEGLTIPSAFSLPSEVVEALRDAVDKVVALNPDTPSDHLINGHLDRAPPFDLHGDPVFGALAAPAILDMVEQLIGPDIILWTTHLFCKQAATGREVPWHQDGDIRASYRHGSAADIAPGRRQYQFRPSNRKICRDESRPTLPP